ncbi:hypothetical protein FOL47_004118 [Perkinsus chesapeaki]|uniref:L-type lectin-like domain-containing protein n=1 Tax=Perkinsus chesapeaki TaxID=330153 RepID=A0A7J6M5P6_PERCH|nr:hypothetical protein FOL47_004118 [Perkinsus chesapeaki]
MASEIYVDFDMIWRAEVKKAERCARCVGGGRMCGGIEADLIVYLASFDLGYSMIHRSPLILTLFYLLLSWPVEAEYEYRAHRRGRPVRRMELMRHSFVSPLTYSNTLGDWFMNGATVATDDHVILTPSIAKRYGIFMHTMPVETNDFEILFDLSVTDGPSASRDSGFALWFTTMNYTSEFSKIRDELQKGENKKDWRTAFNALDYNILGQKSRFDGFGIVFTPKGASGDDYTVSIVTNRNDRALSFDRDVPDRGASSRVNLHGGDHVRVGIRVRPDTIMVRYRDGSRHWQELTSAGGVSVPNSGYIGFTSWSGESLPTEKVSIIDMHVYNMDMSKPGEALVNEVVNELSDGGKIDWKELLTTDVGDDAALQTLTLQKVSQLLVNYIETTQPELFKMHSQLGQITHQVVDLESRMKQLRKEIKATSDGSGGLDTLKNQMVGLREMLTRESGDHKDRVEKVREQLTSVNAGGEGPLFNADDLEDSINSSHSLANKLFILCIIVVVVGGLYVWRQLQVVEKKHLF